MSFYHHIIQENFWIWSVGFSGFFSIFKFFKACAQSEETSEAATHALCAIIEKGMSTEEKFKLVKAFLILFQEKKLFSTNAVYFFWFLVHIY